MNNSSTAGGHGPDGPVNPEPFFPSEGSFSPVVPLSELGRAHAVPAAPTDAASVGRPAEADWARAARRAEGSARLKGEGATRLKEEEDETLVPARAGRARRARREARARGVRPSLGVTAAALVLSVVAGLGAGAYLVWSSQRSTEAQRTAPPASEQPGATRVADEAAQSAPAPAGDATPALETAGGEADAEAAGLNETARDEQAAEVAKAEGPNEAARASSEKPAAETRERPATQSREKSATEAARDSAANGSQSARPSASARAERPTRATAEAREVAPAPKPASTQTATRTRVTNAAKQTPSSAAPPRHLPISSPPPSAKSKQVIQWP